MGLKQLEDVTYFRLNNEINRPVNGQIMLHKDKEALEAFFKENVVPNTMVFNSITDKINFLIEHNYIETAFIKKYRPEFLEELSEFIKDQNFQFKSFMAAYKFYNQYALKTNDGEYYLESMEDRVFFNALYFADGDEAIAIDIANEIIHQRYQPATPSFLNAGRARRGELVSCFLIQVTDDMNSIGRSINSALQLSRIGGGVGISLSNLREAGAPIKGYEGAASGVVPVMKLLKIASLTPTNSVNVKVLGLFTSTSFTQTLSPSFQLRRKMPMKKFVSRLSHLVLWYQINSTN